MKNNFVIGFVSIFLIFAFLFGAYALLNPSTEKTYPEMAKILPVDQVGWNKNAKHVLTEYSDFQCPACANFHDFIRKDIEATDSAITKNTAFVFRHFPLYQIHENAFDSAYAAEAAGKQGKFFEMAGMLYDRQNTWSASANPKEEFAKMAGELKLDVNRFKKDMDSEETKKKVDADLASGEKAGIDSTPTFYLDGKKLQISSMTDFKQQLQDAVSQPAQ